MIDKLRLLGIIFFVLILLIIFIVDFRSRPVTPEAAEKTTTASPLQYEIVTLNEGNNLIHGLLFSQDYLYALTQTKPAKLLKINPADLRQEATISFPNDGLHQGGEDIVFAKGKLWAIFDSYSQINLSQIDPQTLFVKDIGNWLKVPAGHKPSFEIVDNYLYLLTNKKPSKIYKISLSEYKIIGQVSLTGCDWGHAIAFDGVSLFATGAASPAWIAKVNPTDLTFSCQHFKENDNIATDDMAFSPNFVFVGLEKTTKGKILRIQKQNLALINEVNTDIDGGSLGTFYDGKFVWSVFNSAPGKIIRINPESLKYDQFSFGEDENYPNEIAKDANNLFVSFFQSPAKLAKLTLK